MQRRNGFTLVEMLLVVAIIALLISILLPSLSAGRDNARTISCLSNVRAWSAASIAYATSNGGTIWVDQGHVKECAWMAVLKDYYGDLAQLRCCPVATKTTGQRGGVNEAWGPGQFVYDRGFRMTDFGSYGVNHWINPVGGTIPNGWRGNIQNQWRRFKTMPEPDNVPVFGDCLWYGGNPGDLTSGIYGQVPATQDWYLTSFNWGYDMARFCMPRHNLGTSMNMSFADGAARTLHLSKLWSLKWHRAFGTVETVSIPWLR
jgi:prepilin-type N-terminal cleavage/methylation domain-containing protein/prepilin-type processing-associated H-X9-DG protein